MYIYRVNLILMRPISGINRIMMIPNLIHFALTIFCYVLQIKREK